MARRRGISEKIFTVFNPLPPCTDQEVLDKCGFEGLITGGDGQPLGIVWVYSMGNERESIALNPGDTLKLRESEVPEFLRAFKELGIVAVEDYSDKDAVRKASITGLGVAQRYWRERGARRLVELRKTHGFSAEDMDLHKFEHWRYYYNEELATRVTEELARVTAQTPKKKKTAKASAEA